MKSEAHAAFKYIIVKNFIDPGDVINDELIYNNSYSVTNPSPRSDGKYGNTGTGYTWLYTAGRMSHTNKNTQETTYRGAGWSNLVYPQEVGEFEFEILEPMITFCLNAHVNSRRSPTIPNVDYFHQSVGNVTKFIVGTKLFLADGILLIDGREICGPHQINVKSETKDAIAKTNCYGFLFP